MSFTSAAKFCVYDSWDLTRPRVSRRSRLYHLKPIGIGTARTESFTGYIARLAKEHCVSVHSLFSRELVPASNRPNALRAESKFVSSNGWYGRMMTALNGRGRTARDWVEVLERLTLRRGLRFLTMLTWKNVLPDKFLLRSARAWCPRCLQDQRELEGIVYEHLLWTLTTVNVCPHHERRLETICPHCHHPFPQIAYRSRPGHCSRCLGWLGHSENEREVDISPLDADEFRYHLWVSNQMGKIIAAAPELRSDPPRERITNFIVSCPNRISDGDATAFARLVGVNNKTFLYWRNGKAIPHADLLLKVCYRTGVSFSDLLIKDEVFLDLDLMNLSPGKTQSIGSRIHHNHKSHKNGEVAGLLLAALEQDPPPSVEEVAQQLGYKCPTSLYRYPDLCKMLTARHRGSPSHRKPTYPSEINHHNAAGLERTLRQALKERVPPSLNEIGKRLGYASAGPFRKKFPTLCEAIMSRRAKPQVKSTLQQALKEKVPIPLAQIAKRLGYIHPSPFREKFPDLCKAITIRRAQYHAKHRNSLRIRLEALLLEDPPPTLKAVANRFGYKSSLSLVRYHPEPCRAVSMRYVEYRRAQLKSIRHKLKDALHEKPPPSLQAVARRLRYTRNYLSLKFRDVCQAIDKRHRQLRKKGSLERKRQAKKRARLLAFDLHSNGEYPSAERVTKVADGPTGLTTSELCYVLRDVRRELRLLKSG
jgi:AraC-like DNA-binding protein